MLVPLAWITLLLSLFELPVHAVKVRVSVGSLLDHKTDGRVVLLFAPQGTDPLDDTDATGPNHFYGKNVFGVKNGDHITLSRGSGSSVDTEVYGYPNVSLNDLPAGDYTLQAFLTPYEKAYRSDGSVVNVHFPCGDGAPQVNGVGSLKSEATNVTVSGQPSQTLRLSFTSITEAAEATGKEIGGCSQGNYADTRTLKHIKIRSKALSKFWGRDMYIGANVALPHGYKQSDKKTRYPVIYSQGHWPDAASAFGYPDRASFAQYWDAGFSPGPKGNFTRPVPKFILVTFRHETPYYDDSYGVNTANLGPYGDAINEEMIPLLDRTFNTIPKPYARIQEGGSTGGWISIASTIFRPDLFGSCFTYYPDSLDFHKHQDINLYDNANAYTNPDGSTIGSVRRFNGSTEEVLLTVAQENHWELTEGTSSRSNLQWDVWNTVYGVQGADGYPLEPWNKVTGEIDHEAVSYWKDMDLAEYLTSNWNSKKKLGEALKGRLHVSVGTHDNYYLNEGVMKFKERVEALGGDKWANITIIPNAIHGGNYLNLTIWDYLDVVDTWVKDHSPSGPSPLSKKVTSKKTRGNYFKDVIAKGGHQAALQRQSGSRR